MKRQNNEPDNQTVGVIEDLALTEAVTESVKGGGGDGADLLIGGSTAYDTKLNRSLIGAAHNSGALRNVGSF